MIPAATSTSMTPSSPSDVLKRAIAEGDLPADADADALARFVQTVNFGLTIQASTGATRKELLRIVEVALKAWPK